MTITLPVETERAAGRSGPWPARNRIPTWVKVVYTAFVAVVVHIG